MLRPYQQTALDLVRQEFKKHKKVLLMAPTGSGKTVLFCEIIKSMSLKKKKCLLVVKGRKLVDQASQRLLKECVDHGTFMNGHWNFRPLHKIQVASIDTVRSRKKTFHDLDLIVIDEAHMATSKSYRDFLEGHPNTFILGVTATPYTKDPLTHVASSIVHPVSFSELVDQKYLVSARYFAPYVPNLKRVKIQSGDYNQKQLAAEMGTAKISGDIVSHWKKIAENRSTLCFAVSIEHSKKLEAEFLSAGITAIHCDADSSDAERNFAIEEARSGRVKVLLNVGLWGTGVDLPFISCLILARPTQSYILHIQQLGRGTRTYIDKKDFIVLDHAGNVLKHGPIEDEIPGCLDGKPKFQTISIKPCKKCFAVIEEYPCKECGFIPKFEQTDSKPRDYSTDKNIELKELDKTQTSVKFTHHDIMKDIEYFDSLGNKPGFTWHKIKIKYGERVAKNYLSARFRRSAPTPR